MDKYADCTDCPYALWDYESYYGTTQKEWFVCGCKKDRDPVNCEDDDDSLIPTGLFVGLPNNP